jgi:hypothetical protein
LPTQRISMCNLIYLKHQPTDIGTILCHGALETNS